MRQVPPIDNLFLQQPQAPTVFPVQPVVMPTAFAGQPTGQPTTPTHYQQPLPPLPQAPDYMGQMFAAMQSLQHQINSIAAGQQNQQNHMRPATTGMSANPLPTRSVATLPMEDEADGDFSARPIRKRAKDSDTHEAPERDRLITNTKQTVGDYRRSMEEPDAVITGFETLKLDFVTGPLGDKPRRDVIITIPNGGRHRAWFHAVVVAESCVVLVYDTRYENGHQFVPPEMGETPITLTVPGASGKSVDYQVTSMGLTFALGAFDMIMLIRLAPPDTE